MIVRGLKRRGDVVDCPAENIALAGVADTVATAEAGRYVARLGKFEQVAVGGIPSHGEVAAREGHGGTLPAVRVRVMRDWSPRVIPGGSPVGCAPKSSIAICWGGVP